MSRIYKVGVIGVGGIANTHMPGWRDSGLTEVIAASDINGQVLENFGRKHGVPLLSTKAEDLIHHPDIDIIDICTPNNFHTPLAVAALEAGKHVICEKPLAPTPDEIRQMIAVRDRSGKLLMTAQHHRFEGTSIALKAEIDAGALGEIYHARCWNLRRAALPVRPGFILKAQSSGGASIDIGVHVLDQALWFMGNPRPVTVSGISRTELAHQPGAFSIWGGAVPPEMDVEEFAAAFIRFDNGATLILEVSWMLHHNTPVEDMQVWLYGRDGGGHWPRCEIYQTNNPARQHYNRTLQLTKNTIEAHALECIEFARAVAADGPSPVPAEQSLQVMQILDAVYRSQETQREIVLE